MRKRPVQPKDGLTIHCPSCGADIPIVDAVAHAVADQTAKLELAATNDRSRWEQQLKKIKEQVETRLQDQAKKLAEEHATALIAARAKAEHSQQGLLKRLQDEAKVKVTQLNQAQELIWKCGVEERDLKQKLVTLQSNLSNAVVEKQASFEMGRQTGVTQLQKHLDDLRSQMVQRELAFSVRLADGVREAERTAITDEQVRQKAQFEKTLRTERERIRTEVTQEQVVLQRRHENQMQKLRLEIETLHKKSEGAPSDATGQAAEDVLERRLKEAFQSDGDTVVRTKKGQRGADLLITIPHSGSRKLLIECKWTQAFEHGWIAKAQRDRAGEGAEAVIIVSRTLPVGVEHLSLMGDVWVASHDTVLALVMALRQGLLAMERAGRAANLDEVHVQSLKKYLGGPQFRQQVELVVRLAAEQSEGLTKERAQHERTWTQTREAHDKILASAVAIWTALELHSGSCLQPSEVLKPYLTATEVDEDTKPRKRSKAA